LQDLTLIVFFPSKCINPRGRFLASARNDRRDTQPVISNPFDFAQGRLRERSFRTEPAPQRPLPAAPDRLELLDRGTDQARFNRVVKKCPPPGPVIRCNRRSSIPGRSSPLSF